MFPVQYSPRVKAPLNRPLGRPTGVKETLVTPYKVTRARISEHIPQRHVKCRLELGHSNTRWITTSMRGNRPWQVRASEKAHGFQSLGPGLLKEYESA
jgi:hypothetical protein